MKNNKNLSKIVLILILVLVVSWLVYRFNLIHGFNFRDVRVVKEYIRSFGNFAVIAFILFFTLRTLLVVFPYSAMVIIGGSIFGPIKGFIYSMIAVFLASTLAFYTSKLLGKDFVQKLLRGKLKQLDSQVEQHGLKIIFLMRVSLIFPFDILSYAAGLTKVKYRDFIIGTVLGIAMETFSLNYLGHNINNPFSGHFAKAVILILITMAVPFAYNKFKNKKTDEKSQSKERKSP